MKGKAQEKKQGKSKGNKPEITQGELKETTILGIQVKSTDF
jgi:hypothetical protein